MVRREARSQRCRERAARGLCRSACGSDGQRAARNGRCRLGASRWLSASFAKKGRINASISMTWPMIVATMNAMKIAVKMMEKRVNITASPQCLPAVPGTRISLVALTCR